MGSRITVDKQNTCSELVLRARERESPAKPITGTENACKRNFTHPGPEGSPPPRVSPLLAKNNPTWQMVSSTWKRIWNRLREWGRETLLHLNACAHFRLHFCWAFWASTTFINLQGFWATNFLTMQQVPYFQSCRIPRSYFPGFICGNGKV